MRSSPLKTLIAFAAGLLALFVVARPSTAPPLLVAHPLNVKSSDGTAAASVEVGRDRRTAWTLRAPGRLRLRGQVPADASLRFALAVRPSEAPVRIRLVQDPEGAARALRTERWGSGRGWSERRVDLAAFTGREVELELIADGAEAMLSVAQPTLLGRASPPTRPNVILYVVDCLRADHVGAYGYPRPTTPEIDRLARDGVLFESVHACASWTKPAVGCLFTSLYPVYHGAQTVDDVLDPANPTLAEAFRAAGYATAAWVANPFVSANPFGLTRGFDQVVQVVDKPPAVNINDVVADAADITERVVPWLKANRDRQFFLYLHSLDLHAQYRRRPPFDRLFLSRERRGDARQVDLYDNELAANDREIGRLVEALKRERLYERTLVAVTADHGEEFGEHGFTRHGHTLYEPLLRVPLVVKLPRSAERGRRLPALASSLDIAPTLLDFSGVPAPMAFQGLSLKPVVEDRGALTRTAVFAEQLSPKEILYGGRDARFKYVNQLLPSPQELLFDLTNDPGETRSLLPEVPAAAHGLIEEVQRFMQVGQTGYHVAIAGLAPETRVALEVTTGAAFGDVQRFALAAGESLSLSPDRRRLDYVFTAGSLARHLVLRTDPPGADVRLRAVAGGRVLAPQDVALGAEALRPEAVPLTARAEELRVSLAESADLVKAGGTTLRVWYVPPPSAARKAALDPDLEQKLRALGYIQ